MPRFMTISLCLLVLLLFAPAGIAQDTPAEDATVYVIQPGDTLLSIARRYNISLSALAEANGIVNPSLIYWGQQIRIPVAQPTALPPPSEAPAGEATEEATVVPTPVQATLPYTVRSGETLYRIAVAHGTTVGQLLAINPDISNSNLLFAGQVINVPNPNAPAQPAATATSLPSIAPPPETTATAEATTIESTPVPTEVPTTAVPADEIIATMEYGLEVNLEGDDSANTLPALDGIGVSWVKQVIRWRDFEATQSTIDFAALDQIISSLASSPGRQTMLTVTAAPNWSRSITEENGPPDDYTSYAAFIGALASRYSGQVAAYQIWNEPNLRSRWRSTIHPIGAVSYVQLLRQAADAVHSADPEALVVSAGLAPTGYNDAHNVASENLEINAIDDRVFLGDMLNLNIAEQIDAIGVHPMGWANPPDALCCQPADGVATHFEDTHFYFMETLQAYRDIQRAGNASGLPLWITRFGWGSSEDMGPPDEINVFTGYTSLNEQASYTLRAFEIASTLGYVGPMFVYNLNGCQVFGDEGPSSCYYSLIGPRGDARPVYTALTQILPPPTVMLTETITDMAEVTPEITEEPAVNPSG